MTRIMKSRTFEKLTVTLEHVKPSACLIKLDGEMDISAFKKIDSFISNSILEKERAIVIDMSELSFMDSSGIKLIAKLRDLMGEDNVALCSINENVERILEIAKFKDMVHIIDKPCDVNDWHKSNTDD